MKENEITKSIPKEFQQWLELQRKRHGLSRILLQIDAIGFCFRIDWTSISCSGEGPTIEAAWRNCLKQLREKKNA